ncbi:MAG: helix-turn-helix domain-containing protein [Jatrophihabitantaceae bacterium]
MRDWDFRGDVLASARHAAGLSQRALASAIHLVDEDRVGLWERGAARPHARLIPLIARHLHVEPLTLVTGPTDAPDLTRLRVAAGLSLQEMASRAGLPLSSYHRLEKRGAPQGGLQRDIARAIATAVGVPVRQVEALVQPPK